MTQMACMNGSPTIGSGSAPLSLRKSGPRASEDMNRTIPANASSTRPSQRSLDATFELRVGRYKPGYATPPSLPHDEHERPQPQRKQPVADQTRTRGAAPSIERDQPYVEQNVHDGDQTLDSAPRTLITRPRQSIGRKVVQHTDQ